MRLNINYFFMQMNQRIKSLPRNYKRNIIACVAFSSIIFMALSFVNSNTIKSWSQTYNKISTPISSYFLGYPLIKYPIMPAKNKNFTYTYIPAIQSFEISEMEEKNINYHHYNFLIKLLSFGNDATFFYNNSAYAQGQYVTPYVVFMFAKQANYEGKYFPAPSMLLYNFSWLINIPGKFINNIAYQLNYSHNKYTGTTNAWPYLIDDIISLLFTLVIDVPICLFNTVFSFVTGLIYHPLQSILTIPGCFYFCIISLFNAVWGMLSGIGLIFINLF